MYKDAIQHGINLHIGLKTSQETEHKTTQFITILQEAAKLATPPSVEARQPANIPVQIKHLIAAKRKARARWHQTHSPADKNKLNRISNRLKAKLNEARDSSIKDYVNRLSRHDNLLWKPIKSAKKPKLAIPPIRRQTPTDTSWAKSDKEKADLFGEHLATVLVCKLSPCSKCNLFLFG